MFVVWLIIRVGVVVLRRTVAGYDTDESVIVAG